MRALRTNGVTALVSVTAAIMVAQQVAASAVRDAFFLANYPASALPGAVIVSSIISVALLPLLARMMARFGPAVVSPLITTLSALLLVTEWVLSQQRPALAAMALFVHTMVFGSVLVSGFWSLFNERFDPHTAKQLVGRVAGGAAFGGVVGGLLVERAGAAGIDVPQLLPILAVVQLLAAGSSRAVTVGHPRTRRTATTDAPESYSSLLSSSYLRAITLLVALIAAASTIASFLLKVEAARTYLQSAELLRFFARYYLGLGLLGFLLQITVTRPSLNRFGLGLTIAILPAALGLAGLVAFAAPTLWSLALLRAADECLSNSLFRSAYELLYTPIAAGAKRRFKALVDVGFDRLGKLIGSGLVSLAIGLFAETYVRVLLAVGVMAAGAALVVAVRLSRGYVASLIESLRSGAVSLDADVLDEAMTLRTIALGGIDRNQVLALADRRQRSSEAPSIDFGGSEAGMWGTQTIVTRKARDSAGPTTRAIGGGPAVSTLLSRITDLHSGDTRRIRNALRSGAHLDRHLVPHVISLLARDDMTDDAVRVLREVSDRATGQVVDAMLDPGVAPIIRRRLPQVLAGSGSPMAILGLLHALNDSELDVRFRAAGALVRTREAHPDRMVPHDAIFRAALTEIGRSKAVLRQASDPAHTKSVELVFRILSLALEPEPLNLAQRAFRGSDPHLRGTALEYLETVLPADVVEALRPLVGRRSSPTARPRTVKELESELLASSAAVSIDVAALRRGLRQRAADDPGDRPLDD